MENYKYFNRDGETCETREDSLAFSVKGVGKTKYYVMVSDEGVVDPSDIRFGARYRSKTNYVKCSEKIFNLYLKYLKTNADNLLVLINRGMGV